MPLLEVVQKLLGLAFDKDRPTGEFAEGVVTTMIDAIKGAAVEYIQFVRRFPDNNNVFSVF